MPAKKLIYQKKSKIHSKGVFAAANIPKGVRLVQYTGQRLTIAQAQKRNETYHFELNKKTIIDGRNIARYINHSCHPNCEVDIIRGKIWIISVRDIRRGEEICYNYRYTLHEGLDFPCRCAARVCPGYILAEEEWPKLKGHLRKRKLKLVKAT